MAGLRSYRTERTIDFTGLSLVAVIGPTGAGKSSLLEGITYALYGASTWDRRAVKELISDAAPSMRVSLEFEADGELWQVTRTVSKKTPASHELLCLSDSNVGKVDGDRSVNARIEELVGLDYDGFCACVLLPQGKFEQLLKATKKDRASILKGILRLDELDLMRERSAELSRRLTPRCEEIQHARAQFLPDPAGSEEQAATREQELKPRREALEHAMATVDTLIEQVAEHRRIARESEAGAVRIEELVDEKLVERLRMLGELHDELAAKQRTATNNADEAKLDAAAAEKTVTELRTNHSDSISIENAANTCTSAREDLGSIAGEARELITARRQLAEDRETHAAETAQLVSLATNVSDLEEKLEARQKEVTAAEESYEALVQQLRVTIAVREALQLVRNQEEDTRAEHAAKLAACTTANTNLAETRVAATRARVALAEAHRGELSAQLAHGCHDGDPCPVCTRPLPDGFVAPVLPDDVQALQDAVSCAERAERDGQRVASAEEGAAVNAERALNEVLKRLTASTATWEAQLAVALPDGLDADTIDLDETTINRLMAPRRSAKDQLETAKQEMERARSEHTRLRVICEATASEHERRAKTLAATAESLERRRATVRGRLQLLPAWIELGENPDHTAFEAVAQVMSARLEDAEKREQRAEDAERALATAQETVRAIEARIREEVRDPARAERTALVNLRTELARHQVESPPPPAEASSIVAQTEWATVVLDSGEYHLLLLRNLTKSENEAAKAKTDEGREVVTALGFDNSRELQQTLIETSAEEMAARREREQAARQLEPTAQLDVLLAKARVLRNGLNELARQLADGKFVGFVVERRQRALLISASGILSQMTARQFGFTEDFQIIDRRSDMARSPDTLSGGETFLASLALALGLVELAGRSGGRLQALFLDEGFGSLDPDSLDQALDELEQRARAGRLIALISHVPAVAERIDQILRVTKTPEGSDIHLLTDAERQGLLLEDATESSIGAY